MATKAGYEHWVGYSATDSGFTKLPKIKEAGSTGTAEEDDETSMDGGGFEESYPGIATGSFTFGLWKDEDDGGGIFDILKNYWGAHTRFYMQFLDGTAGDGLQCLGYLTQFDTSAPSRGRGDATCTFKFAAEPKKVEDGVASAFA